MDKLNDIIKKLIEGKTEDPDELSRYLVQFSSHLYEISKASTLAEIAYAKKWTEGRSKFTSDKQCEMALKDSKEWLEMQNRRSAEKMSQELIRSLKKRLQVLSDKKLIGF
jgi:hypothetical protein